jgi:hypothetical protein
LNPANQHPIGVQRFPYLELAAVAGVQRLMRAIALDQRHFRLVVYHAVQAVLGECRAQLVADRGEPRIFRLGRGEFMLIVDQFEVEYRDRFEWLVVPSGVHAQRQTGQQSGADIPPDPGGPGGREAA